jgi:serine/threonine protein kinase
MDILNTMLGRYEVRDRLGKGGMATVYKAWDTSLNRMVAVKVLHDYLESDFKERFKQEAQLVARLNHVNIVQVYDFGSELRSGETIYYMVMAYIPGDSLKTRIDSGLYKGERFSLDEIKRIILGVMDALDYAHAQGMIHRDVKPANILFDDQGRPVLADFGIARMVGGTRLTQSGTTSGTPTYMSPEQCVGEPGDARSDIYALGVILFELLTGRVPYNGDSVYSLIMQHVNSPIPQPTDVNRDIPRGLNAVVLGAMAKDPADRFPNVAAMRDAFLSACTDNKDVKNATIALPISLPISMPSVLPTFRTSGKVKALGTAAQPRKFSPLYPIMLIAAVSVAALILIPNTPLNGVESINADMVTLAVPPQRTRQFAPSMTTAPLTFTDTFDDPDKYVWVEGEDADIYRKIENGVYTIRHTLPATAMTTIFDELHYMYGRGFEFSTEVTLSANSQADSATGIVFRYRTEDQYYVFCINGLGQVSLWKREDGIWTELRELGVSWTDEPSVNPLGEMNRLRIVDEGDRLRAYVNDELVIDLENNPSFSSGSIGIYLASSSSPMVDDPFAQVIVDNFGARRIEAANRG